MKFDFCEKIELMHCVEVDTDDLEEFEDVASEVACGAECGEIDSKEEIVYKFVERFGEDKVTFIEDGSGDVEYECY